uniref:Uncharacterized protein n=1 Tax=Leersia perrieri TaxID=77586 RepID=A0A0D9XZ06_9ORYZ
MGDARSPRDTGTGTGPGEATLTCIRHGGACRLVAALRLRTVFTAGHYPCLLAGYGSSLAELRHVGVCYTLVARRGARLF